MTDAPEKDVLRAALLQVLKEEIKLEVSQDSHSYEGGRSEQITITLYIGEEIITDELISWRGI